MGKIIWFTGLSGSGKSTIARALQKDLEFKGKKVFIIDGDEVRSTLHRSLGFSREDIAENNRLIAELAKDKSSICDFVLIPIISPFRIDRERARAVFSENFLELFVDCPLEVCGARDTKGLYAKAKSGKLDNLIGVSSTSPYEEPDRAEIKIRTDQLTLAESVNLVIEKLKAIHWL